MERDALGFLAWIVWEIGADGVAKRHLSLFSQLRDRYCCEHFIHRAEIKFGIDLGRHVEVLLGHPIGFLKSVTSSFATRTVPENWSAATSCSRKASNSSTILIFLMKYPSHSIDQLIANNKRPFGSLALLH